MPTVRADPPKPKIPLDEAEIRHVVAGKIYVGAACPKCREARAPARAVWDDLGRRYGMVYKIVNLEPLLRCVRCGTPASAGVVWWVAYPQDGPNPFRTA